MSPTVKLSISATFICMASLCSAQRVVLHSKGKENGTMILQTKINPDGSLSGTMAMTLFKNQFNYSSHILASGMPAERDLSASGVAGKNLSTTETYGPHSAKIVINSSGKKTSFDLPYTTGKTPKESHVFWFIKTHPKIGTVDSYLYFNLATKKWEMRTTKYVGDDKLNFRGKAVIGHKLTEGDNETWVDDKGLPYLVDYSKIRARFIRD